MGVKHGTALRKMAEELTQCETFFVKNLRVDAGTSGDDERDEMTRLAAQLEANGISCAAELKRHVGPEVMAVQDFKSCYKDLLPSETVHSAGGQDIRLADLSHRITNDRVYASHEILETLDLLARAASRVDGGAQGGVERLGQEEDASTVQSSLDMIDTEVQTCDDDDESSPLLEASTKRSVHIEDDLFDVSASQDFSLTGDESWSSDDSGGSSEETVDGGSSAPHDISRLVRDQARYIASLESEKKELEIDSRLFRAGFQDLNALLPCSDSASEVHPSSIHILVTSMLDSNNMMCRQVEQARSENQILLEERGVLDASLTRLQQQNKMLSERLRICEEARSEVSEQMERYRGNVEGLEDTVKRHQEEKHQLSVQLRTLHDERDRALETNVAHDDVKNGFEHLLSEYIYCRMGMGIDARPVNTLPSTGQPSTALSARPLWDPLRVAKALSQLDTERVDQNLRLVLDLIKTQPDSRNVFIPLLGLFHHLENLRSPSVISNNVAASQLTLAYVRGLTADYIATTISIKEGGKERADKRMGFFHGCRKICVKSGIDSKALGLGSAVIHILASRTSLPL